MKKFERKIEALDSKRAKAEAKLAKATAKLQSKTISLVAKIEAITAKSRAKLEKRLRKFADKNGVSFEVVVDRYAAIQEAKNQAVLDKKITKKLVK